MFIGRLFDLLRETYIGWNERKAPVYAAALAYSTLFSLAPLLIVTVSLASLTVNKASIETRLLQTIETQVGEPVADLTEEILSARLPIETNQPAWPPTPRGCRCRRRGFPRWPQHRSR